MIHRHRFAPFVLVLGLVVAGLGLEVRSIAAPARSSTVPAPIPSSIIEPIAGAVAPTFTEDRVDVTLVQWQIPVGEVVPEAEITTGHTLLIVEGGAITAVVDDRALPLGTRDTLTVLAGQTLAVTNPGPDHALVTMVYLDPVPLSGLGRDLIRTRMVNTHPGLPPGSSFTIVFTYRMEAFAFKEAAISVERLTMPPGTGLPPDRIDGSAKVGLSRGVIGVTLQARRLPPAWHPNEEQALPFGRAFPILLVETTVTIRNLSTEDAVVYRVTIGPSERWVS